MVDKRNPENEDEFHFSDAEGQPAYEAPRPTPAPSRGFERINRNNILIALAVIILAFLLYKMFGAYLVRSMVPAKTTQISKITPAVSAPPPVTVTTTTTQNTPIPVTTPAPVVAPEVPAAPAPTQAPPPAQAQVLAPEATVTQMNTLSRQVDDLNNNISSLSTTTTSIQETITNINQQLQTIADRLQQQQTEITQLKTPPKPKKKIFTKKCIKIVQIPIYYLQGIIPGRAWLLQENGNTVTVDIADPLPGYGKIAEISPVKGLVRTSTGAIIRFRQ